MDSIEANLVNNGCREKILKLYRGLINIIKEPWGLIDIKKSMVLN